MRFVSVKSVDQQAVLMMHRTSSLLVRQRTMAINALRVIRHDELTLPAPIKSDGCRADRRGTAHRYTSYRPSIRKRLDFPREESVSVLTGGRRVQRQASLSPGKRPIRGSRQ
jgi:transposase